MLGTGDLHEPCLKVIVINNTKMAAASDSEVFATII
jgi:hypothetical protein